MRRRAVVSVAVFTALAVCVPAAHATEDQFYKGEGAVAKLGERLPRVAAAHGVTAAELREKLRTNSTLVVNQDDQVVHFDTRASVGDSSFQGEQDVDPTQPFPKLHSDPAATRKIYLDFDGNTYSTGTSAPGSPIIRGTRSLSAYSGGAERIYRIWQRVAEDYAPFNVDVTTEQPASIVPGIWVAVGGTPEQVGMPRGVGGVAPFSGDSLFNSGMAVFVFANQFPSDEGTIADVISHESGHIFALDHDGKVGGIEYYGGHGTGATAWSAIMGYGGTALSHWSRGEYPGANQTQDDILIISRDLTTRADDNPAGEDLAGEAGAVSHRGMIETTTDTDEFAFRADAGPATFTITPAPQGPNLDAQLQLLDADGDVLATANDPDDLGGTIAETLAAGHYTLRVDGVGDVDPLPGYGDYDSLGQYRITGSYVPGNQPPDCSTAAATPAILRGVSHRLQPVRVGGASDPDDDPVTITIGTVTQDEPLDGGGDGDTAPDAMRGDSADTVLLRAERDGRGDGRVYRVAFTARDPAGAACDGAVTVAVPHDADGDAAIDSGQVVGSFGA